MDSQSLEPKWESVSWLEILQVKAQGLRHLSTVVLRIMMELFRLRISVGAARDWEHQRVDITALTDRMFYSKK